jgi:A/G-specific adenine glycosylase
MSETSDPAWAVQTLLDWYDLCCRELPWRAAPGVTPDAYGVWLSEIMLQQTTVKAVAPFYAEFLNRWPRVEDLAQADLEHVLQTWAGLGYYARARNLHACACVVADAFSGRFPETEKELLTLPGIGPYTAAAIAAIAFGKQAAVMDGNVERVLARVFAVEKPLPGAKPELRNLLEGLAPAVRPGDFAQAMMDLGATICTPRSPSCPRCPWNARCAGLASGLASVLPYKAPKKAKPTRRGAAFFVQRADGSILLRKRPANGLLGGMTEVPGSEWAESGTPELNNDRPVDAAWIRVPGIVRHTFTHFHLELIVYLAQIEEGVCVSENADPERCRWVPQRELDAQALPSVMRKVVAHALGQIKA